MVEPTRNRHKVGRGYHGPIPDELWEVLDRAFAHGIFTQSDYARERSIDVALAASIGWISVLMPDGLTFDRVWRVTAEGLFALNNREHFGAGR